MQIENKVQLILADLSLDALKANEELQLHLAKETVDGVSNFMYTSKSLIQQAVAADQALAKFQSMLKKPEDAEAVATTDNAPTAAPAAEEKA